MVKLYWLIFIVIFFCAHLIYHIFLTHCLNGITPITLVSICLIPKTSVKIEILAFLYLVHDCYDHCLYRKLPIFLLKNSSRDATVTKCQDVSNSVHFWHQIKTGGVDTANKISKWKCFELFSSNVVTITCLTLVLQAQDDKEFKSLCNELCY